MVAIQILASVLTSLGVCWFTIYHANKRNKKAMEIQQRNHTENMKLSERKHREQLLINEENERLKYLPYLSLVPKYKNNKFEGEMGKVDNLITIPFEIINEGVGAAFSAELKFLGDDVVPKDINSLAVDFKDNYDSGYDILGIREPIAMNVLRVDNIAECSLYLSAIDENLARVNPTSSIRWEFEITFCDIQERKYSQTYSFFSSTLDNKIYRIDSYIPKLIE